MIVPLLMMLAGLFGLWLGSNLIISGAKHLAGRLRISEAIIGLTVVAIGTSLPELATSLLAGFSVAEGTGAAGVAVGTIVGSNLANLCLVLGICALFAKEIVITKTNLYRDGMMIMMAIGIFFIAAIDGEVSNIEGMVLVAIYLIYILFLSMQVNVFEKHKTGKNHMRWLLDIFMISGGCAALWVSADWVVTNALTLAQFWGIRESIIGLFIGLATSLPELSVSLIAVMRKSGELSVGNLIGSNIANPLLSFGAGAAVSGFAITAYELTVQFPFLFFGSALAVCMLFSHKNLNRVQAAALLLFYALFLWMELAVF